MYRGIGLCILAYYTSARSCKNFKVDGEKLSYQDHGLDGSIFSYLVLAEEAERIYMDCYLTASGHKEEYCKDEGVLLLVNLITEFQSKSNIVS